jgi:hypothetical protein
MNAADRHTAIPHDPLAISAQRIPTKLKLARSFDPCPLEEGEEAFRNGIFEFNITRMMVFIEAHPDCFPLETIEVANIPHYGSDEHLDQATIATADLSRPVLFAEIAPGRFNLIDGHHRVAKARRDGIPTVPAYRIHSPHHAAFLTSQTAYESYVEYWNGKIQDMQPKRRRAL